jgi:hypothetical protein
MPVFIGAKILVAELILGGGVLVSLWRMRGRAGAKKSLRPRMPDD